MKDEDEWSRFHLTKVRRSKHKSDVCAGTYLYIVHNCILHTRKLIMMSTIHNYIADAADTSSSSRIERIKVVALQAPVSDRETDQDNSKYIQHAQQLVSQNQGDEMMPRSSFWAPITASRYISLFDKDGDDDFFSSDLTDEQLRERLGHVSREGGSSSELDVLAVYSGKDEYVPSFVDKNKLLKRMVDAMNDGGRCTNAKGLMLPNANHNLSKSEGDARTFVDAVSELLRKW